MLASLVNDVWVTLGRFAPEYEAAGMQISTIRSQEVVLCQKLVDHSILMGGELLPQTRGIRVSCGLVRKRQEDGVGAVFAAMQALYQTVVKEADSQGEALN